MGYISRLTQYALKYRGHFFGFLTAAGIGTVFNVISPLVLVEIIDSVIVLGDYGLLVTYTLLYLALTAFYMIFDTTGRYVAALMAQHVIYDLRSELYDSLMEKDLAFYDQNETGQILARVTTDVTTMREFLFWGYRVIFIGIVTLIGTYIVMWTVSPELTLIMLTLVPFIFTFVIVFAKKVRPVLYAARSQYGVLSSVLAENVVGMRVVQSFATADREYARVDEENRGFLKLRVEALRLLSFYRPILPTIFGIAVGALIYFGGTGYDAGGLSFGQFVGFVTLVSMLVLPGRFLSWGVGMYQRASASAERAFYILDVRDELMDPAEPVCVDEIKGAVDFENVYFSYRGNNFILQGVDLHVKPGQVVALLGGTGSGKTSLINLIPRFYDVDDQRAFVYEGKAYRLNDKNCVEIGEKKLMVVDEELEIDCQKIAIRKPGRVLVDGVDVRSYRIEDIRRHIGIVHQDPFLFTDSIRENIAFARPEATLEEVQSAAEAAMIHDFVMTLEKGYDTVIGERGITLSGGQKQRVAIARALLANPKILILDDSTSSVDAKTEMMIQKALENLMAGRTTFIITHRLSTIRNADLIVMMEKGQIVEMGSHEYLISQEGLYSSIFHTLTEMELAASYVGTKTEGGDFGE
ncbi:MAG: ABC transporter ATP-binding protein [Candidatus Thorarchaeota archaeon]|nr:ABC transporter ATP-binding protein [Candidatus Thorarchaeota archaeon]